MTREEVIKIFNTVLLFGKCDCPKEEIEECLKMAIKALEEQEPCEDYVSRQAIEEQINLWIDSEEWKYTNATDYLKKRVFNLSSIKPTNIIKSEDKPRIKGDYFDGYKNALRTAKWKYDSMRAEIKSHADRLKDSLYGDGLRHAIKIIDEYKE